MRTLGNDVRDEAWKEKGERKIKRVKTPLEGDIIQRINLKSNVTVSDALSCVSDDKFVFKIFRPILS